MSLDTILQEAGTVSLPTDHTVERGRAALDTATDAAAARVRAIRRARRRRAGFGALVGAAATAALVIGPTIVSGDRAPIASAAQVLLAASDAAGEQGDGWPDASYWHTVTEYTTYVAGVETAQDRRESWMGRETDSVVVLSQRSGKLEWTLPWHGVLDGQAITWADIYALPTDPDALEQVLRRGAATEQTGLAADEGGALSQDAYVFRRIGDLLRESPTSPALRQGLWAVAARLPEVTLVGEVTDAVGRPGTAVELGGVRLVIDPADGRLLEWWSFDVSSTGEQGELTIRETYVEQGPADTAPEPESPPAP